MRSVSLVAIALTYSLVMPSATLAADLHRPDGTRAIEFQRWVDEAELPAPDVSTVVGWSDTECPPEKQACTSPGTGIWINSEMVPAWRRGSQLDRREMFLHELGHQVDYLSTTTDTDRAAFLALRYLDGRPWRGGPNSPHEQFAEAWGYCSVYGMTPPTMTSYQHRRWENVVANAAYSFDPSPARYKRICLLLGDIAVRSRGAS